jgi:hypothetical protein
MSVGQKCASEQESRVRGVGEDSRMAIEVRSFTPLNVKQPHLDCGPVKNVRHQPTRRNPGGSLQRPAGGALCDANTRAEQ